MQRKINDNRKNTTQNQLNEDVLTKPLTPHFTTLLPPHTFFFVDNAAQNQRQQEIQDNQRAKNKKRLVQRESNFNNQYINRLSQYFPLCAKAVNYSQFSDISGLDLIFMHNISKHISYFFLVNL